MSQLRGRLLQRHFATQTAQDEVTLVVGKHFLLDEFPPRGGASVCDRPPITPSVPKPESPPASISATSSQRTHPDPGHQPSKTFLLGSGIRYLTDQSFISLYK